MMKYVVAAIIIILVAMFGLYFWQANLIKPAPPTREEPSTSTYATSTPSGQAFSITYSSNYFLDDTYTYNQFEGKPIAGVNLTIPVAITEGTNLSSDTYLSVEWLPRAQKCTGDIYLVPNVKAIDLIIGSTTYSTAATSGAAAGNRYEEQVYAIKDSKPCTAVRYFIHSSAIENFSQSARPDDTGRSGGEGESAVREFDRAALIRDFDGIRDSLILRQ